MWMSAQNCPEPGARVEELLEEEAGSWRKTQFVCACSDGAVATASICHSGLFSGASFLAEDCTSDSADAADSAAIKPRSLLAFMKPAEISETSFESGEGALTRKSVAVNSMVVFVSIHPCIIC